MIKVIEVFNDKKRSKGKGVVTDKNIKSGALIETCKIVKKAIWPDLTIEEKKIAYRWDNEFFVIVDGGGSFYNDSATPSAQYSCDKVNNVILIHAIKNITVSEKSPSVEIEIEYGYKGWIDA